MNKYLLFLLICISPTLSIANDQIGVGVPLSGDGAWLGKNVLNGINLYLKENNIDPKSVLKIEDVSANQTSTSASILGVRKLIDTDKVSALVLCISPVVNAVAPYIDEKQVPTVAIVGAETAVNRTHQVRLWPSPSDEAQALSDKVVGKKIAILYAEQDAMLARKKSMESTLSGDTKVVLSSVLDNDTMNTVLTKLIKARPEAVILLLMPGQNGLAVKKLRQLKYHGLFLGSPLINSESEIKLSEGALKDVLFPDVFNTQDFIESFKKEYHELLGVGAAPGYDAGKLIFEALNESKGDKEKLNELIHRNTFSGSMGTYGILPGNSNNYGIPVVLRRVGED